MSAATGALRTSPKDPGSWGGVGWSLAAHALLILALAFGAYLLPSPKPMVPLGIQGSVVTARDLAARTQPPKPDAAALERQQAELEEERRLAEERKAAEEREALELKREQQQELERQQAEERKAAETQKQQAAQERKEQERLKAADAAKKKAAEAEQRAKVEKQAAEKQAAEKRAAEQKAAEKRAAEKQAAEKAAADKAAEQKRRAEAARENAAADMARQLAEEEGLNSAADSGALARYQALIAQRVTRNWAKPPTARDGIECAVNVRQSPAGDVMEVSVGQCNGDESVRRSIEAAVRRSSPLPLPDDPRLFERNLRFTFKPEQ